MIPMHWYYGGGGGVAMVLMVLFFLLVIGGTVAVVAAAVTGTRSRRPSTAPTAGSAEEVVRQRFARGEIDLDEMTRPVNLLRASR